MPAQIDVYREWLGITDKVRPLNHYQLMRLNKFEDDVAKIRANYRKMNAHVRKYASGEFQQQSQDLLNELAKSMLCLTDARRKAEYDASLGRADTGTGRKTLEQILIQRKICDPSQIVKARNYSTATGIEIHEAIIQQKLAVPDDVMQCYAESLGLPYVDLEETGVDKKLVPMVPAILARQHSFVPVLVDDDQALMASPNPLTPDVEEELRLRLGMTVRSVLCTATKLHDAVNRYFPKEAALAELSAASRGSRPPAAGNRSTGNAPSAGSPEEKRQKLMLSIVGFNLAFVMAVVIQTLIAFPHSIFASTGRMLLSMAIAAIVGLIGAVVARFFGG